MDAQADTTPTSSELETAPELGRAGILDQIPGGRYHIVERLSTGAIGAVYKALDTILDRPVAVKCVRLDTPFADHTPDELRERFVREARIAARLQHPNIVTIHDIVATSDRGYIIMEFIEGRTLESLVESERRLPLATATKIVSQLASALDYAHERNVVHRDVKPSNILVSPSMYVWVTDFGIAKSELSTNLTMAGGVLGTPDYMSPEQAKGEDVDARSDLFSLGCILFECVVGEKPFRSPSLTGVLLSIINDELVFPLNWRSLGLPMQLKPILYHALEKERVKRFASGAELMRALEGLPGETSSTLDVGGELRQHEVREEASPDVQEDVQEEDALGDTQQGVEASPGVEPEPELAADEDQRAEAVAEEEAEKLPQNAEQKAETPVGEELEEPGHTSLDAEEPPAPRDGASVSTTEPDESAEAAAPVDTDEEAWHEPIPDPAGGSDGTAVEEPAERPKAGVEHAAADDAQRMASTISRQRPPESEGSAISAEQIRALKDESQVLHLSPTLSADLQGVEITPEEGFLLSRIDGASQPNDIMSVSPMPEGDTARALLELLQKKLIRLGGVTKIESDTSAPDPRKTEGTEPDAAVVAEVDRLLALADAKAYHALLGLSSDVSEARRKGAYVKIVAKYHPDRFPTADRDFRDKLSRLCAAASESVTGFEHATDAQEEPKPSWGSTKELLRDSQPEGATESEAFDKKRHARELFHRAVSAFDKADYWDTIQLVRQAIEADEQQAEYYGLLGRALLQNKKWRRKAVDNFLKATELAPHNVEYIGLLGAIYKHEGLSTRADALLRRARDIDPAFEFPNIDS